MKKIEVIFRPEKLEPLKEKLLAAGVQGVTCLLYTSPSPRDRG